jgi:Pyruvate/2-oxoacid:ferredoxin oxidoreductase delta subunit
LNQLDGRHLRVVLYEGPGSTPLTDERRFEMTLGLLEKGYEVTRPTRGGAVGSADASTLVVLGQFEEKQPDRATAAGSETEMHFRDISGEDVDAVVATVKAIGEAAEARPVGQWKPWFPVIDYDRCTNCMQCLSFCLFDVYGVDEKSVIQVQHENHCKTDCPACSRVCPEVAILFPKYGKGPINGDVVKAEDVQREAMKVDISALLGGDIYASLRSRQKDARKRFSTERDESRALLERKKCLKKLQSDLDIPDEVLMTLPSVGDIQERAERAKVKTEKRMARSQTVRDQRPAPSAEEWGI